MANQINRDDFLTGLLYLLEETFESSKEGEGSAFLDRGVGFFRTLDSLTAEHASRVVGETTIAAHTEHTRFYLEVLTNYLNSRGENVNWADSWRVRTVNKTEWKTMRENLRESYQAMVKTVQSIENWNEEKISEAVAILAHTAYHFGAIRQILKPI